MESLIVNEMTNNNLSNNKILQVCMLNIILNYVFANKKTNKKVKWQ